MTDTERTLRCLPLDRLIPSPENVRKTPAEDAAFAELKASIAAHGLLENLLVRAAEPDHDGALRFEVVAGARRLAALQALADDGALAPDRPVPCHVMTGDNAAELSLAENTVRAAMHPADQVEAFAKLAHAGGTVAEIAARFGVSERTVEKRLRLGNAAPELLDAYRAGEMGLQCLQAFCVTTDVQLQLAVWEELKAQHYGPSVWQIRRLLTEGRMPATSALARFVGAAAYEAGGGALTRDLFAEEDERGIWFDDPGAAAQTRARTARNGRRGTAHEVGLGRSPRGDRVERHGTLCADPPETRRGHRARSDRSRATDDPARPTDRARGRRLDRRGRDGTRTHRGPPGQNRARGRRPRRVPPQGPGDGRRHRHHRR